MTLFEDLQSIEMPVFCDKDWLYHGFSYGEDTFNNILKTGIKSAIRRGRLTCSTSNGPFYISVSQNLNGEENHSAFYFFNYFYYTFILENVKAYPCTYSKSLASILCPSPLPYRPKTDWYDERQVFWHIKPENIIGIGTSFNHDLESVAYFHKLDELKKIILAMQKLGKNLPVLDFTDTKDYSAREINQEDFLELTRHF